MFEEEQEKIFQNSWQFVAHGAEVAEPGQYVTAPANPDNNVYTIEDGATDFASIYVWPNLSIGRIPGQAGILLFRIAPTAPEHTTQESAR